jgi:hypothetical protein
MKTLLISGLTLALLTGGAFAQASGQPPAPPAPGMAAPPPPPAPPAPGVTAAQPPAPPPGAAPAPPPPGGPEAGNDMDGPHGRRPPPPPPSKAAHFRFERGDGMVDVKCADEEPMKVCADFALQMIDRLQAMPKP